MPTPRKSKASKATPVPISVSADQRTKLEVIRNIKGWGVSEIYSKALDMFYSNFLEEEVQKGQIRDELERNREKE